MGLVMGMMTMMVMMMIMVMNRMRLHKSFNNQMVSPTSSGGLPATERLLFSTSKPRILEMTLLMADYMNMMGANLPKGATRSTIHSRSVSRPRLQGVGLTSASTPNTPRLAGREASTNSLARSGSTSSGMRRTGGLRSADL